MSDTVTAKQMANAETLAPELTVNHLAAAGRKCSAGGASTQAAMTC